MIYIYYIIFCIITIIIIFLYFYKICQTEPEIFTYDSKVNGPTILIIGTTHGNEPAGYFIIKNLIDKLNNKDIILKQGQLILIPLVNYCGYKLNMRNNFLYGDINRQYNTSNKINKFIIEQVINSDFIIDFHEGWGFHKINNNSIGSTITANNTYDSIQIANNMINDINYTIKDENYKFTLHHNNIIDGTLQEYVKKINKNYILIEITGQNNIQPLNLRINQGLILLNNVFIYYDLL